MIGNSQTRWHVFATVAKLPTYEYPFCVIAIDASAKRHQEILCRSKRDCLLVGNGIATGLMIGERICDPNTVFDDRVWPKD